MANRREAWWGGNGVRGANGSGSVSCSIYLGSAQGNVSSGNRKPIGESPASRNSRPRRKNHLPPCQTTRATAHGTAQRENGTDR